MTSAAGVQFGQPTRAMAEAIRDRSRKGQPDRLPSGTWATYAAMCLVARESRRCWASVPTIADLAGLSTAQVKRCLYAGEAAGLWRGERRFVGDTGRHDSTVYTLNDHQHAHLVPALAEGVGSGGTDPSQNPPAPGRGSGLTEPTVGSGGTDVGSGGTDGSGLTEPRTENSPQSDHTSDHTPSATADGRAHARAASDETEAVDAGLAEALTAVGDALSVGGGFTPGQDGVVSDGTAPEPASRPVVIATVDRAEIARRIHAPNCEQRLAGHAVDRLRRAGAPTPPSVRSRLLAVVQPLVAHAANLDEIADRLDDALARISGVEAAAS